MAAIVRNADRLGNRRTTGSGDWLADIRQWLRHARAAIRRPHQEMEDLSERDLRDIAARHTDIGRLIDRDKNWILQASLTRAHSRRD